MIGGKKTAVEVIRSGNKFTISAGDVSATLTGLLSSGEVAPLDEEGAVRLSTSDMFEVSMEGFAANSDVDVWMYSTPTKLGTASVDSNGEATERYALPGSIEAGTHRVVLRGENQAGDPIEIAFGMFIGSESKTSTAAKILIAIPIALAILLGLLIPTALRRRRKDVLA